MPLRLPLITIPPITPLVNEQQQPWFVCPCYSTRPCASLPGDMEASRYGRWLPALVEQIDSTLPLSFSWTQALLDPLLGTTSGGIVVIDRFSVYNHVPDELPTVSKVVRSV